ncbi:hypothetical protein [Gloeothece verrucosa]|uniref:Uncharacterized protein n=1 Tax=Gloeothece verrucosa (strain PCC 7822) TaxID=497965 RepID=E0UAG8_GLOV7|nr:hypothetical protein [Gloeothece verrucosa]ADN12709.1 conserved hypothetical protein [Gloeothece verrucosa PCC 7822]
MKEKIDEIKQILGGLAEEFDSSSKSSPQWKKTIISQSLGGISQQLEIIERALNLCRD